MNANGNGHRNGRLDEAALTRLASEFFTALPGDPALAGDPAFFLAWRSRRRPSADRASPGGPAFFFFFFFFLGTGPAESVTGPPEPTFSTRPAGRRVTSQAAASPRWRRRRSGQPKLWPARRSCRRSRESPARYRRRPAPGREECRRCPRHDQDGICVCRSPFRPRTPQVPVLPAAGPGTAAAHLHAPSRGQEFYFIGPSPQTG